MDAQSDSCEPPPCDPQPPGKIRKALKLFSKRKPGSGVAGIFSVRVKGEGGLKSPPSRSKTLDELTETVAPQAEADSVDQAQEDSHKEDAALDEPASTKNNLESTSTRQSISSLTSAKSLSFLSILRQNRKSGGEEREAQTESLKSGQQRKGLKSLFGSIRWHRKNKEEEDEVLPGHPLLASRSNSVEITKENLTLTPRLSHHSTDESEFEQQPPQSQDDHVTPVETNKVSGAAKPSTNNRLSTLLGDISSILSLESLEGGGDIVADVEAEWVKVSSRVVVEARTVEAVKKEKTLLAPNPTLSAAPTLSSTFSTIPSPITKLILSSTPPKNMASPTTKRTLSPPSTPSSTTSIETIPSHISPPTFSLTKKSMPSPVLSPYSSLIPSSNTIPVLIPIPKSPPTTPTLTVRAKPLTSTPTSPLTPEPSPKPSPTLFPDPFPATISRPLISFTEKAPQPAAAFATITQPTHTLSPTTKPAPTAAPIPIAKNIHSIAQDTKHSSAPVTKYPPFITSTKPVPNAPVIRPKIVTTFGLSTSRNTAPIIKPEPKQSVHQITSSPIQLQTEKNGSGSVVPKALPADSGPPHVVKCFFAASMQLPAVSSATSENPLYKPDLFHTSLPSGSSLLPTMLNRPGPIIAPCYVPRGEKGQEDGATPRMEDFQHSSSDRPEKNTLVIKPTSLSKIPVSGGGKSKQCHKDIQSNGEERKWNLPTPVLEEETLISLSQETSSKDALSDLSTESGAITPVLSYSNEDTLDSAAHPTIGTVSIPRESKIPIKSGSTATYHSLQGKTKVARSKIPVSKVPLRTSNKTNNKTVPTSGPTAAATQK